MSRTDERIREDLRSLTDRIELDGVFDRVARRRTGRRIRRRVERAALVIAVLGASLTATVVLTRAFGHPARVVPGGGATAGAGSDAGPTDVECDYSTTNADVDGDGEADQVSVGSPGISADGTCAHSDAGQRFELVISGGKYTTESPPFAGTRFYGAGGPLPECQQPQACQLFAVPDLNGDGAHEVAVQVAKDGQVRSMVVYRWDAGTGMTRVAVAAPGDSWSDRYGIEPGPATLYWGASPDAVRSISCVDRAGSPIVVVSTALPSSGGGWDIHETDLRLEGDTLIPVDWSDQTVQNAPPVPADLCGAHIWKPGDNP